MGHRQALACLGLGVGRFASCGVVKFVGSCSCFQRIDIGLYHTLHIVPRVYQYEFETIRRPPDGQLALVESCES